MIGKPPSQRRCRFFTSGPSTSSLSFGIAAIYQLPPGGLVGQQGHRQGAI
jgi:hypothetical protein